MNFNVASVKNGIKSIVKWFILFAFLCGLAPGSLALQNAINRKGRKGKREGSGKSSDSIATKKIFLNANEFQRGISEKWIQIDRQWFILFAFLCGLAVAGAPKCN
jgi:hypothetical protein